MIIPLNTNDSPHEGQQSVAIFSTDKLYLLFQSLLPKLNITLTLL